MISKIKSYLDRLFDLQHQQNKKLDTIISQNNELEWAHIYHDSIRGKTHLENLAINVGRWAGNYSFFYVLNRILSDFKPKNILDLGLGESSKFISCFIINELHNTQHTIIEQDENWADSFLEKFSLSNNSKILHLPLEEKNIKGYLSYGYKDFDKFVTADFDLMIVDGPFGSDRFSRYDIISLIKNKKQEDEFIILFDDTNRAGERDTKLDLINILEEKNKKFYIGDYSGVKTCTIICTEKYKFSTSL